jgi:hypothetical protein
MSALWFLAIVPATGLAWLGILLYFELRNQHHIWHDPCITPANRRDDIRHVLRVLHGVLAESGVTWWLDYGTLLGAWRLGDLMAFDHDLDLSFLGEDSARLAACGPALAPHGIELDLEHTRIYYRGDKIGDMESWWRHGARLCRDDPAHRSGLPKYWRPLVDDFPARWVDPVARIRFIGALYPCPNSPEAFLRRRYLTCRLHLRLVIPHKQKCWISREFWSEARRIWTYRDAPRIERYETRP